MLRVSTSDVNIYKRKAESKNDRSSLIIKILDLTESSAKHGAEWTCFSSLLVRISYYLIK